MIEITNESYRGSASAAESRFNSVSEAEARLSELFEESIELTPADYVEVEPETMNATKQQHTPGTLHVAGQTVNPRVVERGRSGFAVEWPGGFVSAMPLEATARRVVATIASCAGISDPADLRRQRDDFESMHNAAHKMIEAACRKAGIDIDGLTFAGQIEALKTAGDLHGNSLANLRLQRNWLLTIVKQAADLMGSCLNADGSWHDCPAANKRELLDAARAAIARARKDQT
ncbi:MAG: hypothetical protein PHU85_00630 [Phycisphaerae bacterium]|nr:hypothetical protein [Phycisphaerae bacterium]